MPPQEKEYREPHWGDFKFSQPAAESQGRNRDQSEDDGRGARGETDDGLVGPEAVDRPAGTDDHAGGGRIERNAIGVPRAQQAYELRHRARNAQQGADDAEKCQAIHG